MCWMRGAATVARDYREPNKGLQGAFNLIGVSSGTTKKPEFLQTNENRSHVYNSSSNLWLDPGLTLYPGKKARAIKVSMSELVRRVAPSIKLSDQRLRRFACRG